MSKPAQFSQHFADTASALDVMNDWPSSWAGVHEDEPIGKALVTEMRPFVEHLARSLASKSVRGHLNNLWVIGGEIIRQVNYDPQQRELKAHTLLLRAIESGEAHSTRNITHAQQDSLDATALRLLRFMTVHGDSSTVDRQHTFLSSRLAGKR